MGFLHSDISSLGFYKMLSSISLQQLSFMLCSDLKYMFQPHIISSASELTKCSDDIQLIAVENNLYKVRI